MDESMKKAMEEARKRYFCDVWAMSHARSPRSINEIDFNGGWKYAIEACLEYLGKAASAAEAELLQLKETAMDTCECYDKDPVGLAHVIIDLKALARR